MLMLGSHWERQRMPVSSGNLELPEREVHAWYTDFSVNPEAVYALLSAEERGRERRFKVPSAREEFIKSHAFVRLILARYLHCSPEEIRFRTVGNGKPELVLNPEIQFNLSHTEGTAALAVSRNRRVGIDVEKVRANLDPVNMADRFFSATEAAWLRSQPVPEQLSAFFTCWTAKESYIKGCGDGLSMPLGKFTLLPDRGQDTFQLDVDGKRSDQWSFWSLRLGPELRGAVAAEGRDLQLKSIRWNWHEFFR